MNPVDCKCKAVDIFLIFLERNFIVEKKRGFRNSDRINGGLVAFNKFAVAIKAKGELITNNKNSLLGLFCYKYSCKWNPRSFRSCVLSLLIGLIRCRNTQLESNIIYVNYISLWAPILLNLLRIKRHLKLLKRCHELFWKH